MFRLNTTSGLPVVALVAENRYGFQIRLVERVPTWFFTRSIRSGSTRIPHAYMVWGILYTETRTGEVVHIPSNAIQYIDEVNVRVLWWSR